MYHHIYTTVATTTQGTDTETYLMEIGSVDGHESVVSHLKIEPHIH